MANINTKGNAENTYDVIVVGSGISGGWAAKEFCDKGLKTLVIERGREVIHNADYPTTNMHPWEFQHRGQLTDELKKENPIASRCYVFQEEAVHYLQSPTFARGLVIYIQWWMWFGATIIILMAGMTGISVSLYESAMVDGANAWQMFWRITVPLLKPILIYIFVTSLVGGMQMFDIPYLLTDGRGSPSQSILTNNILMYLKFASSRGLLGAASAVGVAVFIMTCVCAFGIFYFLREKD